MLPIGSAIDNYEGLGAGTHELVGTLTGAAKTFTMVAESADLLKFALIPLAAGSTVNAIRGIIGLGESALSVSKKLKMLSLGFKGLGLAVAAFMIYEGTMLFTEWLASVTNGGHGASETIIELEDALQRYARLKGNPGLVTDIRDMADETHLGVGQMRALETAILDLPVLVQSRVMTIFARDGFDAAREELDRLNGKNVSVYADADLSDLTKLANMMRGIPEEKLVNVKALMDAGQFKVALTMLESIPREKNVQINIDGAPIEEARGQWQTLEMELADGTTATYRVEADKPSISKTKKVVDDELSPLKILEIKTELDMAKLEAGVDIYSATLETLNTQIEWGAKIDIAGIEADAQKVQAAFESIGGSVQAVSANVGNMFSGLTDMGSSTHFYELFEAMNKEMSIQEKLINAQIELTEAQTNRIESGEPIGIQVESSRLAPALEMIFQEVLEMTQTTANAEGLELLGVKG